MLTLRALRIELFVIAVRCCLNGRVSDARDSPTGPTGRLPALTTTSCAPGAPYCPCSGVTDVCGTTYRLGSFLDSAKAETCCCFLLRL